MPRTRALRIIAQDPSIRDAADEVLTATVEVPHEALGPGPRGYRVHVVDYDTTHGVLYSPADV